MKTDYNFIILIMTDNSMDVIEDTLLSAINQTFDKTHLKIVVVDNYSTDGTYEELLTYVKKHDISVYRMNKKYIKTRLMHKANLLLNYTLHRYITILMPGDVIAPDFIEKSAECLDNTTNSNARILMCETDVIEENGQVTGQIPLYETSRILNRQDHFIELFTNGLGHKVQCVYRAGIIPNHLVDLTHFVDFTDCFKKAFLLIWNDTIYVREPLARIHKTIYKDPMDDLFFRWYFIVRLIIYRDTINNHSTQFLEPLSTQSDIYRKLSQLAIEYAREAAERGYSPLVRKILLFTEMVNSEIRTDFEYKNLNQYLAGLSDF